MPHTDESRTPFGLPRSGRAQAGKSSLAGPPQGLTTTDTGTHGTTEAAPDSAELEWGIAAVTQNCCVGMRLV